MPRFILSASLIAMVSFAAAAAGSPAGHLAGTVLYQQEPVVTGRVLASSTETLFQAWTFIQSDGSYRFDELMPGGYTVRVFPDGVYRSQLWPGVDCPFECVPGPENVVDVLPIDGAEGIDFLVDAGGLIRGALVAASDGAPIEALLELYDDQGALVRGTPVALDHQDDGFYEISGLPPGDYYLRAVGIDRESDVVPELWRDIVPCETPACDVTSGEIIAVLGGQGTTVDFALERYSRITGGGVLWNGAAVQQVTYQLFDAEGDLLDQEINPIFGLFGFERLLPGTYYLRAIDVPGHLDELYSGIACEKGCLPTSGTPIVFTGGEHRHIEFAFVFGPGIQGRVLDSLSNPAANVRIDLWDAAGNKIGETISLAQGGYHLAAPAGEYRVSTFSEGVLRDEVYDDVPCPGPCNPLAGAIIDIEPNAAATIIDFTLGGSVPTFADSFETGDFGSWSSHQP